MSQQAQNPRSAPRYPTAALRDFPGDEVRATTDLHPGSTVSTSRGERLTLRAEIGKGGEGTVFRTSRSGVLAKVYMPTRLTSGRVQKLELMVARGLNWRDRSSSGICWPRSLLRDGSGVVRGYFMEEARGLPLGRAVFVRTELKQNFPGWTRKHIASLCLSLLRRMRMLHREGVIMGDINPENFLVESERRVFFVDTDSYQLAGFPCPVGTDHFTPRELQGKQFAKLLRTQEHENFAVATLLFMIVMLGKQPYACRGGGSPLENIRRGEFPYPLGKRSRRTAPEGSWRFIWSHLPYEMKKAFFETFDRSCANETRRSVTDWIELFSKYEYALENGYLSEELYPSTLKPISEHARTAHGVRAKSRRTPRGSGSRRSPARQRTPKRGSVANSRRAVLSAASGSRPVLTQARTGGLQRLQRFFNRIGI